MWWKSGSCKRVIQWSCLSLSDAILSFLNNGTLIVKPSRILTCGYASFLIIRYISKACIPRSTACPVFAYCYIGISTLDILRNSKFPLLHGSPFLYTHRVRVELLVSWWVGLDVCKAKGGRYLMYQYGWGICRLHRTDQHRTVCGLASWWPILWQAVAVARLHLQSHCQSSEASMSE